MTDIQIFKSEQFGSVRVLYEDGKPLFCGKDVCKALGYTDTTNAMKQHCRGVAKHHLIDSKGRNQQTNFIPEGDLYRLICHSKLPSAEKFEHWVFDEVLPTLRQNGSYQMGAELNQLRAKNEEMEKAVELLTTCKNHLNKVRSEMAEVKAWQRDAKAKYMQAKANYGTWCDLARSYDEVIAKAQNNVNACIDNIQSLCISSRFDNMGRLLDDDAMFNTLLDTVITPMMKEAASCKTTS